MDDNEIDASLDVSDVIPGKPVWVNDSRGWDAGTLLAGYDDLLADVDELDSKYLEV